MKTIEEASNEYAKTVFEDFDENIDFFTEEDIFKAVKQGVEFAQRWIPIEEQELPVKMAILCKRENSILPNVYYFDISTRAAFVTAKYKIISWRPIEIK